MDGLDNVAWHALTGAQAQFAAGSGGPRRYASGFSPIVAFADRQRPDFAALAACAAPNEPFYCADWNGALPAGWTRQVATTLHQMVWRGGAPDEPGSALPIEPLAPRHVDAMLALVELTQPGPIGPRTIELGDYVGCFDEAGRLVAMAGERMHSGTLREASGVCTHPSRQGRRLARALVALLLRRALQRGETPFLHVMHDNAHAITLYERMGFEHVREAPVQVLSRDP